MAQEIPILRSSIIRGLSRFFIGFGDILLRIFPSMELMVDYSGIEDKYGLNGRDYMAVVFTTTVPLTLLLGGGLWILLNHGGAARPIVGPAIGLVVGGAMFFYLMFYPKSIVNKRVKYLERNLLYALRSLLVQIRSGIPVFNAMASIATGKYGPISSEFKDVVEKVNAGESMVGVLEHLAVRNPSIYFRRSLWQLVNSIKSGSDVGKNLEDIIASLSKEQMVEIRRYKSVLNPLAMMYMMIAVIAPSLGITLLIILSTFPGMSQIGREEIYWMLLAGVCFMQFIFLGLIKSKRPNLIGS
ncbi:MAG TPA: hypothetical protein ENN13_00425 [Candidatus Altiarchaeales archaeon]|nr:hypothetical protein [Candidatus Altiarchaeales archaeon]